MRRSFPAFLLLLSPGLFAAPGFAQQVEVGRVVRVVPVVRGGIAAAQKRESYGPLTQKAKILVGTEVVTTPKAGARIRVGTGGGPQGSVDVGPESVFLFEDWVAQAVGGGQVSLRVQIGSLLAYFQPRRENQAQLITIETPSGKLYVTGTAVYLKVEPDGSTSVLVLEGTVRVASNSGGDVEVTQGNQTRIVMGEPPTPPTRFDVGPAGLDLGLPTRPWINDPPLADLDDPRLDLPK